MLSCWWYNGVISGCLLIKWNKTNLQCLKSGWTKTSCAIQLWSIMDYHCQRSCRARFIFKSTYLDLRFKNDTVTFSQSEVKYFFTLTLSSISRSEISLCSRTRFLHTLIFYTSEVKMHEMLTSWVLFPPVMSESGRCDGLLIREGRNNSHLSVINKGLMKVVYQMKTAERLQDKSRGNFSRFRHHLASRQLTRRRSSAQIYSVRVRQWSRVTRLRVGRDPTCRVSRRFTAAWIRPADTVIAVDGSYSPGHALSRSRRHPQRLTTLSLRKVKSFPRLSRVHIDYLNLFPSLLKEFVVLHI